MAGDDRRQKAHDLLDADAADDQGQNQIEKTRDYKAERERRAQPSGAQKRRAQTVAKEAALDARLRAIFAPRTPSVVSQ